MDGGGFDYKNPDYVTVFRQRAERLAKIRAQPGVISGLQIFYKENPVQFIMDWGMTYDPRNIEIGLPAHIPFILFPKQVEWCYWALDHWRGRKPGLTEKSRECGVSWCAMALACTLSLYYDGFAAGFGSNKEIKVDQIGNPDSLFEKGRLFMEGLPVEFRGGWNRAENATYMRLTFPRTGAHIIGEVGDNIGRGGRSSIYFVDESAHLQHPYLVDAGLASTTNCRMDITSVKGMANSFAQKRHSGRLDVFTFHWRDDPRKDEAWHTKQVEELGPVIAAQEIDIDYAASSEGVLIPSAWVQAAVDADKKLGFDVVGPKIGALDVADEGIDLCAFAGGRGVKLEELEAWTGINSDTYKTALKAFHLCDEYGTEDMRYDADGLGAYIRGDANAINEIRRAAGRRTIKVHAFRGSGGVHLPLAEDVKGRKNEDYFANAKAQACWSLRTRFGKTYRAVVENVPCNLDQIIVIDGELKLLSKLLIELAQPTYTLNTAGKILVDKAPDNTRSPNLFDATMIRFAPMPLAMTIPEGVLQKSRRRA